MANEILEEEQLDQQGPGPKYKVAKSALYDLNTTLKATPNLTAEQIFKKFPEFNNDAQLLQSAMDYVATVKSGKYKTEAEIDSKFPEFDFAPTKVDEHEQRKSFMQTNPLSPLSALKKKQEVLPTPQERKAKETHAEDYPLNPMATIKRQTIKVGSETLPIETTFPGVKADEKLAKEIQHRVETGTTTVEDARIVGNAMNISPLAANAILNGKTNTGTAINIAEKKAEFSGKIKGLVEEANKALGLNDDYEQVTKNPQTVKAYLEKLEKGYAAKKQREIGRLDKAYERDFERIRSMGEMSAGDLPVGYTEAVQGISDANQNAYEALKGIFGSLLVQQINSDPKLSREQKVATIRTTLNPVKSKITDEVINERLSPFKYVKHEAMRYMFPWMKTTSEEIAPLEADKAQIELALTNDDKNNLFSANTQLGAIAENLQDKKDKGEQLTNEEAKVLQSAATALQQRIATIEAGFVPEKEIFKKYPILLQQKVVQLVNDYNALKSGNIEGRGKMYENTTLEEHLAANDIDPNDQRIKDILANTPIKDYGSFGRPLTAAKNVILDAFSSIANLTGITDDMTALSSKAMGELFPTEPGKNDEYRLKGGARTMHTIASTTGQVIGQGVLQFATAGAGKIAGLAPAVARNAAFATSGFLTQYDNSYKESFNFIESKVGRMVYAAANAGFSAAAEKMFPDMDVLKVPGTKEALVKIAQRVGTKDFTQAALKESLNDVGKTIIAFGKKYSKTTGQEVSEEDLTSLFHDVSNFVAGDKEMNVSAAIENLKETTIQTALGMSAIAGFSAVKDIRTERNVSPRLDLYNAALYHDAATDAINKGFADGKYSEAERDEKLSILTTAVQSLGALKKAEQAANTVLSRGKRGVYVSNLTAETILNKQIEANKNSPVPDAVLDEQLKSKVAALKEQRTQLLTDPTIDIEDDGDVVDLGEQKPYYKIDGKDVSKAEFLEAMSKPFDSDMELEAGNDAEVQERLEKIGGKTESLSNETTTTYIPKAGISSNSSEGNSALRDVESTAKALEKIARDQKGDLTSIFLDVDRKAWGKRTKVADEELYNKEQSSTIRQLAYDYHKAKADGTNPELVKAVEEALSKPTTNETKHTTGTKGVEGVSSNSNEAILNSVNPTGSIFADYKPEDRMKAKLADNMTTLDKTDGGNADDIITIYRGVPNSAKEITGGDFVTTNKQLAKDYAGTGKVIEKKVRKGDLLDDKTEPLGEEYIYRPNADKEGISSNSSEGNSALRDAETKQQIENFGVNKTDVEPVHNVISQVFDGLKKAGLTAAKTVGEWVGIGKGEANPNSLDGIVEAIQKTLPKVENKETVKEQPKTESEIPTWIAEFERTKTEKDLVKMEELYNKIKVVQNGVLQGRIKDPIVLEKTIKELNELKKQIEDYAENWKKETQPKVSEVTETDTKKQPINKIEDLQDVGEKIGGAKKDLAQKLSDVTTEDLATKPLSKVFPKPDFKKLVEEGSLSEDGAILLNFLYEKIPAKPRKQYRVANWVKTVDSALQTTRQVLEAESTKNLDFTDKILKAVTLSETLKRDYKLYSDTMKGLGFPKNDVNLGGYEIKKFENRSKFNKETGKLEPLKGEVYSIVSGSSIIGDFKTMDDAVNGLKTILNKSEEKTKGTKFDIYQDRKTKEFFIGKKGAIDVVRVMQGFKTLGEARNFLKEKQSDIQGLWDAMKAPKERRMANRPRVGVDWRKGKNVDSKEFADTFGFRGVEFGNWVNNAERQSHVNEAYDALMDLSSVLGVSPKALSLNGELGFAFGARGSGKANAHYEAGKVVINLTKTRGAGSLAHEWWHAMDNYFSRNRGQKESFITQSPRDRIERDGSRNQGVRKEMIDAFKSVMDAIESTKLAERSKVLDRARSDAYWSTNIEMSARSFENYIIEKLGERNQQNDYLANFKETAEWINDTKGDIDALKNYPYPLAEESPIVNEKFQQFFETIKEDESGKLFKDAEAQYRIESGKNIVEAIKDFDGSPRATVALTHEIMHPTVVAIIDGAKEGNEVGTKHTETIVNEFNKANPNSKVTVEDLINGNDAFKDGTTSKKYRQVQEFIAKAWEKYHREGGKGFSAEFQKVLDQITKVFQSVYKSLTGEQLTPELHKMFDEILGKEALSKPTTNETTPTKGTKGVEGISSNSNEDFKSQKPEAPVLNPNNTKTETVKQTVSKKQGDRTVSHEVDAVKITYTDENGYTYEATAPIQFTQEQATKVAESEIIAKVADQKANREAKTEYEDKNGNRVIQSNDGWKVVNTEGKEVSTTTARKVHTERLESFDFTKGEDGVAPDAGSDQKAIDREMIATSTNPVQLLDIYERNIEPPSLSTAETIIADHGIGKISKESFEEFSDSNNITMSLARTYFAPKDSKIKPQTLDQVAHELSEDSGIEITPEDVANFMVRFPNGMSSDAKPNDVAGEAAIRFEQVTGFKLDNPANNKRTGIENVVREQQQKKEDEKLTKEEEDLLNLTLKQAEESKQATDEFWAHLADPANEQARKEFLYGRETTEQSEKSGQEGTGESTVTQNNPEAEKEKADGSPDKNTDADTEPTARTQEAKGRTVEQKNVQEQLDAANEEYRIAKDAFTAKRKELDETIQSDQEDLFGERKSKNDKSLFDERVDPAAKDKALAPLKARMDKAKAETERLAKNLADLEGKPSAQMDIGDAAKEKYYEEVAGSKPNTNTGRIAVSPIIGQKPKEIRKIISDFLSKSSHKLLYLKTGRRAAGFYSPGDGAIRLKYANDLDTTAHEAAHAIDDKYKVMESIVANPNALRELPYFMASPAASKPPQGHPDPLSYKRREGFAEWLRAYIVNPDQAKKEAPEIYKIYEANVDKGMKSAIQHFSNDLRSFHGLSGRDKVLSNIQVEPDKNSFFGKFFNDNNKGGVYNFSWVDKISANFLNPLRAFEKAWDIAKGLKGVDEVLPEGDPTILARLLLGYDGKFGEILQTGMIGSKGEVLTDGNGKAKTLGWLLEPLDNTDEGTIKEDFKDVLSLMLSERVIELSKRFGDKAVISGFGGGIVSDLSVAKKALEEMKTWPTEKATRINEAATRYRTFADDVLKYMVDKGRMSSEQYEAIKKENVQYVAMKRIVEQEPGTELEVFKMEGGKIGSVAKPVHTIHGSSKTIQNPYVSLLDGLYKSVREADRNEILLAFRDMLHNPRLMGDGDVIPYSDIAVRGKLGDKNAQAIFVDGKPEYWVFQKDIHDSIKGLSDLGSINWAFRLPASVLRETITKFPVFAIRNIVRDTQDRLIKSNNSGITDLFGNKKHWAEVARFGGLNAGFYMRDKNAYYGLLDEAMHKMAKDKNSILLNPAKWGQVWHHYESLLQKSETSNRVAEYRGAFKRAKAKGMDDYNASLFAASEARGLIDFAIAGHWMRTINQIIPFTNAAVQGMRSSAINFSKDPAAFSGRMALYSVLPTIMLWMWNHRGDEEEAKEYEALPGYQRDLFWNFKIGKNNWLSVPKPYELSLAGSAVDRGLSAMFNKNENSFNGYGGTVVKSIMPLDESGLLGPFKAIIEGMTNYDTFRDKDIVPAYEEKLDLSLRHTENASQLSQWLQKASGWDARKIDHFISGQFGYFGKTALKISDIGSDREGNNFDLTDLGLFKKSPGYNSPVVQDMVTYAEKWGLTQSRDFKIFKKMNANVYGLKTDEEKDEAKKEIINTAEIMLKTWKAEGMDKVKQDKFVKKQEDNKKEDDAD